MFTINKIKQLEQFCPVEFIDYFENISKELGKIYSNFTNDLIKVLPFPGFVKEDLKITKTEKDGKITFTISASSTDPITNKSITRNEKITFDMPGKFTNIKYERGNLYFIFIKENEQKPESSDVKID